MQRGNWRRNQYERENFHTNRKPRNSGFRNNQILNRDWSQNNSREYGEIHYENNPGNFLEDRNSYSNRNFHHHKKPYDRPLGRGFSHHQNKRQFKRVLNTDDDIQISSSPLEIKIYKLLTAVQDQGLLGQLVFITNDKDNSTAILQNAVQNTKNYRLNVSLNSVENKFELSINDQVLGKTDCNKGKQIAKNDLCEIVLQELKKKCFYITRKENFEKVPTGQLDKEEPQSTYANSFEGSKAYSMMLKMGWGGKGLGVQEQGEEKTVAEKMVKNISKEGLGTKNVIAEVDQILQDYMSSSKITTLAFDSSFSKEERAQIHNLAQKYNLKSKSLGKEPERRITITKKMAKWDLVKELLRSDLENDSYKLSIPENFQCLWQDVNK